MYFNIPFINPKLSTHNKLLMIGSFVGSICLAPFAYYRFTTGDYLLGTIDSLVILLGILLFFRACCYKIDNLNHTIAVSMMVCFITVLHILGPEVIFWLYPLIAATYFLVTIKQAVTINILGTLNTLPAIIPNTASFQLSTIYATTALLGIFGFIYAKRTEIDESKLEMMAREDSLTGVENRRALDARIGEVVASFTRYKHPCSMLLIDLDHFKKINDTHGHLTGDKILIRIANIIEANIRRTDRLYRYGGEEFVLIANNTKIHNANKLAEHLRKAVLSDHELQRFAVTISLGVSELTTYDDEISWLTRADQALYKAKNTGRNCSYVAIPATLNNTFVFERSIDADVDLRSEQDFPAESVVDFKRYRADRKLGETAM